MGRRRARHPVEVSVAATLMSFCESGRDDRLQAGDPDGGDRELACRDLPDRRKHKRSEHHPRTCVIPTYVQARLSAIAKLRRLGQRPVEGRGAGRGHALCLRHRIALRVGPRQLIVA